MKIMSPVAALLLILGSVSQAATLPAVRVSSKIDTEGALLGNIIQQVLESKGIKTVNKIQLGATSVLRNAIIAGEVDIYPEYTGNGAFFFSEETNPVWKSASTGYERVKKLDFEKNRIVWLTPAPANNTWTIALRKDVATAHHIKSLADLGKWINSGGAFKLAASAEFEARPDALPAFAAAYGFSLKQDQLLTLAGGDTTVTIKAAAEQTSDVNAAMAYGTDGPVAALGLVTLSDPKGVQPIYAPTPIIRADALARYPGIRQALKPVFASLTGPTLQKLNARIAIEGQDAKAVAHAYLLSQGFIH